MLPEIAALVLFAAAPPAAGGWTGSIVSSTELADGARFVREDFRNDNRLVRLNGVVFSSRNFTLRVIDNPRAGGVAIEDALRSAGCIAGSNGGYFHPDLRPLGLVVSNGVELHGLERARLLSGILAAGKNGIDLYRVAEFKAGGVRDALQAGPFLVDGGRPSAGLEVTKSARRTVIATDGHRNWALLTLSPCTLAEAGRILSASRALGRHPVRRALNLDGGSSSGLWVDAPGSPYTARPLTHVANYLGVAPLR